MSFWKFLFGFTIENDYSDSFFTGAGIWICVGVLVVCVALLAVLCLANRRNTYDVYALAFAAICIAASFGLSYLAPMQLPQGGSVTVASLLPICLYAYIFGAKRGLLAGLIYGLLQIIQKPVVYNLVQVLLDYTLAFSTVAIAGLFPILARKWRRQNRFLGFVSRFDFSFSLVFVGIARYVCHVLSGVLFFGMWAPEGFNPWAWSLLYNLFVFADIAICIAPAVLLQLSSGFMRYLSGIRAEVTRRDKAALVPEPQKETR